MRLHRTSLLAAVLVALLAGGYSERAAAQTPPNVLVVLTDDQRWDTLDFMPTVQNELAAKGVTFSNAFVVNAVCCPSRASLLTGRWSHSTGVWSVFSPHGIERFDDSSTLATWLDAAGYRTALLGKYLNGYLTEYVPPGWDDWFGFTLEARHYFDYGATEGGAAIPSTALWFGSEPEDYATDVLADRAEAFVRSAGPEPFFLYVAPKAPHIDIGQSTTPAPRHAGTFDDLPPYSSPATRERNLSDKPRYVRKGRAAGVVRLRRTQLESLLAVDELVAGLLAALDDTGKLADTLIVFTSDNGYLWGEHNRTRKIVPYEPSIRVPLVVRWDAGGLTQQTVAQPVLNVDVAPMIADAAGIAAPGAKGRSPLPLARGEQTAWRTRFLFESAIGGGWPVPAYCAFRGERWKYVQYHTGEEEIYDLRRDPYELRNIRRKQEAMAMRYRERVARSKCRPPGMRLLEACTISGTGKSDTLRGTRRPDWICAGAGRDVIDVRRGRADTVDCGPGRDTVYAEPRDKVAKNCERVVRST